MKRLIYYTLILLCTTLQTFAQTTYTYDNLNRLTSVEYGNGVTVSYTYDVLGNRTSRKVTGSIAETYTITVSAVPSNYGTVSGGGTYGIGTNVELKASPYAGFEFEEWNDGSTVNPRTITVTGDQSFAAHFKMSEIANNYDVNGDGVVNSYDLDAIIDTYLGDAPATAATDIDGDGVLTIADASILIVELNDTHVDNNGHEYVDLGLPSGTLWATCNVGASTPEELGDFYAWGETETKDDYSWATYKWCDGSSPSSTNSSITKYCDRGGYGMIDGKISLELEDDVAHVKWGGKWHMPTRSEFQELMDHCTVEWIKLNDNLHAYRFTGNNGNSIIMPASGRKNGTNYYDDDFYYWSSELLIRDNPANNHANNAVIMEYSSETESGLSSFSRFRGLAVRPVLSDYTPVSKEIDAPSSHVGHQLVDLGLPSGTLWATCNLGASSPDDYGCYYAWGEISGSCDGKTNFTDNTYDYYDGNEMTKYLELGAILESGDDAATNYWGGAWRMPTNSEITELINTKYTTCEWATVDGVDGYRITSIVKGFEGNSIFLPAAGWYLGSELKDLGSRGHYWTSTLRSDEDEGYDYAGYLDFISTRINKGTSSRCDGMSIRPVVSLDAIQ